MKEELKSEIKAEEKINQQAELEAAADNVASGNRAPIEEKKKVDENTIQKDVQDEEKNNKYLVVFREEYEWTEDDKTNKISKLDMSKILNLTTVDLEVLDRILRQLNHNPENKYKDTTFCKYLASMVTGMPVEFFNKLKAHDMNSIVATVYYYFLVG